MPRGAILAQFGSSEFPFPPLNDGPDCIHRPFCESPWVRQLLASLDVVDSITHLS